MTQGFHDDGKSAIIPKTSCPYCGTEFTASSTLEGGHLPSPGDMNICIKCGGWTVFTEALGVRAATHKEIKRLPSELKREMLDIETKVNAFRRYEASKHN